MSPWTALIAIGIPTFAAWIGALCADGGEPDWQPTLPPARLVPESP